MDARRPRNDWAQITSDSPNGLGLGGNRVRLGTVRGRTYASESFRPVLVLGPQRSGKTSGFAVPTILEWAGPALVTSVRRDVLDDTHKFRGARGRIYVFDPAGALNGTPYEHFRHSWDVLDHCKTWDDCVRTANALTEARQVQGVTDADFWSSLAAQLIAPHLFAAATSGVSMQRVAEWIKKREKTEVEQTLVSAGNERALMTAQEAWSREDRVRDSVYTTAASVLRIFDYTDVSVDAPPFIDLEAFLDSEADTLFLCAPPDEQEEFRDLFTGLVRTVIQMAYAKNNRAFDLKTDACAGPADNSTDPCSLLLLLDEAGNIATLKNLITLATTSAGTNIQLVTIFHDLSQIEGVYQLYPARSIVSNHSALVVLPGTRDDETLAYVQNLVRGERIANTEEGTWASPKWIRGMERGTALLVYENLRPVVVNHRSKFNNDHLRLRAEGEAPPVDEQPTAVQPGELSAQLIEAEAGKVRLAVRNDRRWRWVARALAAEMAGSGQADERSIAAARYDGDLSALLDREPTRYVITVCDDESCVALSDDARGRLSDPRSELDAVVVLAAENNGTARRIVRVLFAEGRAFDPFFRSLGATRGGVPVVRLPLPDKPVEQPKKDTTELDAMRRFVSGSVWLVAETAVSAGHDLVRLPTGRAQTVAPGDWVLGYRSPLNGSGVSPFYLGRVGRTVDADGTTTIALDKSIAVPEVPGEHSLPAPEADFAGISLKDLHDLLPPPASGYLAQSEPTFRALSLSDLHASKYVGREHVALMLSALKTGNHVVLRGSTSSHRNITALAILRGVRDAGISADVAVRAGRVAITSSEPEGDSPPPPGYPTVVSEGPLRPLSKAVVAAAREMAWLVVREVSAGGAAQIGFALAALRADIDTWLSTSGEPFYPYPTTDSRWRMIMTTDLSEKDFLDAVGTDTSDSIVFIDLDRPGQLSDPDGSHSAEVEDARDKSRRLDSSVIAEYRIVRLLG